MQFSTKFAMALIAVAPVLAFGQQVGDAAAPSAADSAPSPAVGSPSDFQTNFARWFELREMDFSLRYRNVSDSNGVHEFDQAQQRGIIDGKFKFDKEGKYGIVVHGSTGKYFNWAYADFMGGGTQKAFDAEYTRATPIQQAAINAYLTPERIAVEGQSGGWAFYVRRLYLDLEPIKGIEMQYGSLDINRGAASEITTYDYDGYVTGERLIVKRPQNLFFDEASVTYAYFGDLYTPNFFARADHLLQATYHQFLVRKAIAKRLDASFDYTWQNKSNTFREAVIAKVPELRFIDSVRGEFYERANAISFQQVVDFAPGGKGFAVTLMKKNLGHRLTLEGGYAHIDPHQGVLTQMETSATFCMGVNGDAYGLGTRYFVHPTLKLNRFLDLTGFYTHELGSFSVHDQIVWNKQALNAGFVFDMKKAFFGRGE